MRVLYATSECVPFGSTGGLGDVSAALPAALKAYGVNISRVMPLFRSAHLQDVEIVRIPITFEVPIGTASCQADVWRTVDEEVPTYFIGRDAFFDRPHLYGEGERDYEDNLERFLFFQQAAVLLAGRLEAPFDVIHCNDWTCGLIPLYARHGIYGADRSVKARTLLTIHNLAYQGRFPGHRFFEARLPAQVFTMDTLEFYGDMNFLKAGIAVSDRITTVSLTYAREILKPEFGCGLEGVLQHRRQDLFGIANGVDYHVWNPSRDPYITAAYAPGKLEGKRVCREHLVGQMGLSDRNQGPILGMITRLAAQKGLDTITRSLDALMAMGVRLVILGDGNPLFRQHMETWAAHYPGAFAYHYGFDIALAHQIEAGCDIFLMPSHFEPCGLNQLYSLKYGTVPVVNPVGGLADTIIDASDPKGQGTGFRMHEDSSQGLLTAVQRALQLYADPNAWAALQDRGMRKDFSWKRSARQYAKIYRQLADSAV